MTQNERRPGGLEYRLTGPDGEVLSGDLPATGAGPGWTYLDWDDAAVPGRPYQDLMIYTQTLPDGAILTVGRDLSDESKLRHALKRVLFWCGAVGRGIGPPRPVLSACPRGAAEGRRRRHGCSRGLGRPDAGQGPDGQGAASPDDIDELGATFNTMLDEIATLVSRVCWVSTDIAHDLRTPLTHVRQKLERIKTADRADPGVLAAADEIEADVDEAAAHLRSPRCAWPRSRTTRRPPSRVRGSTSGPNSPRASPTPTGRTWRPAAGGSKGSAI